MWFGKNDEDDWCGCRRYCCNEGHCHQQYEPVPRPNNNNKTAIDPVLKRDLERRFEDVLDSDFDADIDAYIELMSKRFK